MLRTHELRRSDGLLYLRYMRSLRPIGRPKATAPGVDVRTCANCGRRALFYLDPAGNWYTCTACGHLA